MVLDVRFGRASGVGHLSGLTGSYGCAGHVMDYSVLSAEAEGPEIHLPVTNPISLTVPGHGNPTIQPASLQL